MVNGKPAATKRPGLVAAYWARHVDIPAGKCYVCMHAHPDITNAKINTHTDPNDPVPAPVTAPRARTTAAPRARTTRASTTASPRARTTAPRASKTTPLSDSGESDSDESGGGDNEFDEESGCEGESSEESVASDSEDDIPIAQLKSRVYCSIRNLQLDFFFKEVTLGI